MKAMVSNAAVLGIFFVSQFGIGFIGNTLLLTLQTNILLFQHRTKKPIDWIFIHLTLANVMTILFSGVPEIIHYFGIRNFLDDAGCKAVLYLFRVGRGLSLCTTSLLSMFQAVIITPSNSRCAWLKPRISTCIFPAFLLFWILNMLIYIRVIMNVVAPYNSTEVNQIYSLPYCISEGPCTKKISPFLGAMVTRDVLCLSLMILTSMYMVRLLFTHRRTVQHIHRTSLCPRASPETKATHTILALVSCFVFFYWTDSCLTIYRNYRHNLHGLENISLFLACSYPSICPFLLIKNNERGSFLNVHFRKSESSH
ncbi:vomeronasal type-1 receptor 4-like [Manis pentadactyla]|uniref:vomeronasal type-1 receptor 4-like n=1 Tax=Manis pentadactyla TaxID=143292 RepID=UPI00255C3A11|nr:vomeronasal type-1 receptor 4-like [Manis pentadactyla]